MERRTERLFQEGELREKRRKASRSKPYSGSREPTSHLELRIDNVVEEVHGVSEPGALNPELRARA